MEVEFILFNIFFNDLLGDIVLCVFIILGFLELEYLFIEGSVFMWGVYSMFFIEYLEFFCF